MVSTFLDHVSANLFGISRSGGDNATAGDNDGGKKSSTDLRSSRRNRREVILSSFGEAGEIVNDVAKTVLNAVTVWKYQ